MIVAGVDGCPDGWVAAVVDVETLTLKFRVFATFRELVAELEDAVAIGIDIPIGLMSCGSRQADTLARKRLPGKTSSVFSAPHPEVRRIQDYATANARSKQLIGKGLTIQCFHILRKIAEVNDEMTPDMQARIIEVHPEVSFAEMNEKPILLKKGRVCGFNERAALLRSKSGLALIPDWKEAKNVVPGMTVRPDDTLDAIVAAWTALRFSRGEASRVPKEPEIGFGGLRAEIVF
ncbi:MAG: DUF429 domain-containing protein [Thermomicrobiales bacterium]